MMNEEKLNSIKDVIKKDGKNTSDVEELAARLQKVGGFSDKTAHVFAQEWKRVAGTIVIVLLGVIVYNQYREGELRKSEELGSVIAGIQGQYRMLVDTESIAKPEKPEDIEKLAKARESAKAAFEANYSRAKDIGSGTIGDTAELYRAELALKQGNVSDAKSMLEKRYGFDKFTAVSKPSPAIRVNGVTLERELASLLYVRVLLADAKVDMTTVRERLKAIALSSQLVCGEALVAMARLAQTPDDRVQVANLVKELSMVRPELENAIKEDITKSGIKF